MKGLLRNNYYSMQENIKLSFILVLFIGIITIVLDNALQTFTIAAVIVMFPINIGSSLQTDETSKWNKFETTIPVRRRSIVKCKYFSYLMLIGMGTLSSIVIALISLLIKGGANMQGIVWPFCYGISLSLFSGSLMYPCLLKFGALKSELIIIVSAMVGMFLTIGTSSVVLMVTGALDMKNNVLCGIVSSIVALLCFLISYYVSVSIHGKKEFS